MKARPESSRIIGPIPVSVDLHLAVTRAARRNGLSVRRWVAAVLETAVTQKAPPLIAGLPKPTCHHPESVRRPSSGIRDGQVIDVGYVCELCGTRVLT